MANAPPFAVEGIDHITIIVRGMDRTLAFYRDVLGCADVEPLPEFAMAQVRCGAQLVTLVDVDDPAGAWARPPAGNGRNLDHFCLALGPFEHGALRAHLARQQVEIIEESVHAGARGESLSFYIRDPSGTVVELKGPPVP